MTERGDMNSINLSDVRVVVTGASSGLGLAMAEGLLRAGASVALGGQAGRQTRRSNTQAC
jgi:NAD(P)-dependent dehydrogenase (short-subunit alcohol dehydrogenase family)